MKNLIKTSSALLLILTLSSCGSAPTTYDAPLEPGQTTFQTQGNNNQDNNIPEPGQNQMQSQSDNSLPEPGQTQMKSSDDDDVAEPGQTEMK